MKISISSRLLHFKQPAGTSRGVYTTHLSYYITVTRQLPDGSSVTGVGEASVLPDLSCDALPKDEYERNLCDICGLVQRTGSIPYEMLRPYPSILFALETAFAQLDAGGNTAFYDTPFAWGEEGITINGLVWMGTFEEMFQRMEEKLRKGFHCVKLKIGAIDFDRELELVRYIRKHFGPDDVELRVDANGGFTPDNAMERLEALAPYHIHSIEQPVKQKQWDVMARLCKESPLPIALDEELIGVNTPSMKEALLNTIHPQYLVLKPSLHGGMRGCQEWINMARSRGIGSWITSALESNVGLNAIAQFCARTYGPHITFPQGLGTGLLYEDNIDMPLEIRGEKLWYNA
ncbi:MAG: o-succinylbenzoate synthase [Prevotella sp.]|jgi:o-succinylbenzoate synthase